MTERVPNWLERISLISPNPYLVTILLTAASIPLGLGAGGVFAAGALALAGISFVQTKLFLRAFQKIGEQRVLSDDRLSRSQIFSSVDELSAGIAHEINNPLGIIAQEIQWIQHLLDNPAFSGAEGSDDLSDSLRQISSQVDRCKEIVQKLLSLARQMEPVLQFVDVNDLIRNMIDLAAREASSKEIQIVKKLEPDLPVVQSDPPLLRQVLLNLLLNATQSVERRGVITVKTERARNGYIEISVEDSGCGIPKEHLSKIFTPYFSTKPEGKGTGLGLAISRGIIERLGGYITVTSEPGKRTVFTVSVPVSARRDSVGRR